MAHSLLPWTLAVKKSSKNRALILLKTSPGIFLTGLLPMVQAPLPDTKDILMLSLCALSQGETTHLDPKVTNAHDRDIYLAELKYCSDTIPFPSLQTAADQHASTSSRLRTRSLRNSEIIRVLLAGASLGARQFRRRRAYAHRRMADSNPPNPH
eukprot:1143941-Pelagomonas_calceolata.AAC.5